MTKHVARGGRRPLMLLGLFGLGLAGALSAPNAAPNPAANAATAMTAAQAAFLALPEAERKAIQDDLIWAGGFTGATSGSFGLITFHAIRRFQRALAAPDDGILTPAQRQGLAARAKAARDKAGFRILHDDNTGAALGVPTRVLTRRDRTPAGSRWQSADGRITLDTRVAKAPDTLETLYDRATAQQAGRKVTYRLLKPRFFVVTGETETGRFYIRLDKGDSALRGFSIGYDKTLAAQVEPLVIAVADSFEAFPAPAASLPSAVPKTADPAPSATAPAVPRLLGGLRLPDGRIVTATAPLGACRTPGPALMRADAGLSLLAPDKAGAPTPAPALSLAAAAPADGAPVIVLSAGATGPVFTSGTWRQGAPGAAVEAALQPGGGGSLVLDRTGALAGIVTAEPVRTGAVAGTLPVRRYAVAPAAAIAALAGGQALAAVGKDLTSGEIAAAAAGAVAVIRCDP